MELNEQHDFDTIMYTLQNFIASFHSSRLYEIPGYLEYLTQLGSMLQCTLCFSSIHNVCLLCFSIHNVS